MNRANRRRRASEMGLNWRENMRASKDQAKIEERVLRLSPMKARQMLAEWASQPHSQEEVDKLNGAANGVARGNE